MVRSGRGPRAVGTGRRPGGVIRWYPTLGVERAGIQDPAAAVVIRDRGRDGAREGKLRVKTGQAVNLVDINPVPSPHPQSL